MYEYVDFGMKYLLPRCINILLIDKFHVLQNNLFAQDEMFSFSLIATKNLEYN